MDTTQQKQLKPSTPQLPGLLALPMKHIPKPAQYFIIERALNHFFATALKDNRLDFLGNHVIAVTIKDAYIDFSLRLHQQKLTVSSVPRQVDLSLSTDVYTLLELISQKEDADGLFFSRRLDSRGNTELGLYVKNFLAALDPDESQLLALSMTMSQQLLKLIERKNQHKLTKVIY